MSHSLPCFDSICLVTANGGLCALSVAVVACTAGFIYFVIIDVVCFDNAGVMNMVLSLNPLTVWGSIKLHAGLQSRRTNLV